ncbi:hypothetical protein [Streptomyces sp. 3214.6]|uniref:hypothetical protein n=1 Tax=Streptomyces sp. 3214.6 TaxID=1882757 RepID=UPI00090A88D6|nr:hypothetical protein [Streptomyces sp. 3214.6]SHH31808.1 hypothetical protein SAMN05444521_0107 [Streptomyces sp. 3214.6]
MPENTTPATELTSQYSAQVAGDLERNTKEQERIGAEIEALQEQLGALQHDHSVLVSMQQALGGAGLAQPDTTAAPSVPEQASAKPKPAKATKAVAAGAKKTASKKDAAKKTAAKASSATVATTAASPTLVELIRTHVEQQSEPRSAAEISSALGQAHPDRNIKTTVVRTTLEGLVAKSHAHRTKQGSSVFYTAAAAAEPAAVEAQPEAAAG